MNRRFSIMNPEKDNSDFSWDEMTTTETRPEADETTDESDDELGKAVQHKLELD